jgi:hypothetical protein
VRVERRGVAWLVFLETIEALAPDRVVAEQRA